MKNISFIVVLVALQLTSCRKDDTPDPDTNGPSIVVNTPVEGQVVIQNDTLRILASINDVSGITQLNILLKDGSGNIIWHPSVSFVPGGQSLDINEYVINNLAITTSCVLELSATNSNGYNSVKRINVVLNGPVGGIQTITSQNFALGFQLVEEAIHIADQVVVFGNYGICDAVTVSASSSSDPDTLTIDFGVPNCLDFDNRFRRGIIQVVYSGGNYFDSLVVKQMTFNNYFVNDVGCNGTVNITNNGTIMGIPTYSVSSAVIISNWSFTTEIHTTNTVQQVNGQYTVNPSDDRWQISGNASGTDQDGRNYTAQITAPLIRAWSCWSYIIQGQVHIVPLNSNAQNLDYGNGSCDNSATVIVGANTYTIGLF